MKLKSYVFKSPDLNWIYMWNRCYYCRIRRIFLSHYSLSLFPIRFLLNTALCMLYTFHGRTQIKRDDRWKTVFCIKSKVNYSTIHEFIPNFFIVVVGFFPNSNQMFKYGKKNWKKKFLIWLNVSQSDTQFIFFIVVDKFSR